MQLQGELARYRRWATFPVAYGSYLALFYVLSMLFPMISDGGCTMGYGYLNPEFYGIFIPRFVAAALFVFLVSILMPDRKLLYAGIASIVLIASFLGFHLFPLPLWNLSWSTPCLFIANDISSLGSLAGLTAAYWLWGSSSYNKSPQPTHKTRG